MEREGFLVLKTFFIELQSWFMKLPDGLAAGTVEATGSGAATGVSGSDSGSDWALVAVISMGIPYLFWTYAPKSHSVANGVGAASSERNRASVLGLGAGFGWCLKFPFWSKSLSVTRLDCVGSYVTEAASAGVSGLAFVAARCLSLDLGERT